MSKLNIKSTPKTSLGASKNIFVFLLFFEMIRLSFDYVIDAVVFRRVALLGLRWIDGFWWQGRDTGLLCRRSYLLYQKVTSFWSRSKFYIPVLWIISWPSNFLFEMLMGTTAMYHIFSWILILCMKFSSVHLVSFKCSEWKV